MTQQTEESPFISSITTFAQVLTALSAHLRLRWRWTRIGFRTRHSMYGEFSPVTLVAFMVTKQIFSLDQVPAARKAIRLPKDLSDQIEGANVSGNDVLSELLRATGLPPIAAELAAHTREQLAATRS